MRAVKSQRPFNEVRTLLLKALEEKNLRLFAEFDHAANAQGVDLRLTPTVVLVFGNAEVGTYLMQDDPACAIHLPLKMAIFEGDGGTEVRYESPEEWQGHYNFSEKSREIITKMTNLLQNLVDTVQ